MRRTIVFARMLHSATFIGLAVLSPFILAAQDSADPAPEFWLWTLLGRLHPLAVHFPVALIIFAALLELFTLRRFDNALRPGINLSLAAGSVSAIFAALAGWFLFSSGDYTGNTAQLHQWSGFATVALSLVVYLLAKRTSNIKRRGGILLYRFALFFTAILVSVAGHFGASLTHGDDYITSALPGSDSYDEQAQKANIDFVSLSNDSGVLSPSQQSALQVQVKSIFAHHCYKCHGPEKVKGDLRLDNKEMIFRGGESGPLLVPGKPSESEVYRRITFPKGHKEVMPQKGKLLSEKQIAIIRTWIEQGAPWPDDDDEKVFRTAALEPRNPPLPAKSNGLQNPVDIWVNDYFSQKKLSWPQLVDDRVFLRRIYLDIIGLLPSATELQQFEKDPRPDKRSIYVQQLLNRNDDYAIHWMSFWNDALRNDYTGTGYITDGRSAITEWLYEALRGNKPYDQFVQELINPGKASKGFIDGIRWRGVVNASQSTEIQAAQNVAQVFLGLNLKCASCHNSFINNWKLEDAYAFANIFSDTSMQISRCDKPTGKYTKAKMLWEQLGEINNEAGKTEKQKQLAQIIVKNENGRFYRTMVNRLWARLMGRGIVEPVDVMDNEPWSQDLLDWLAFHFATNGNKNIKEIIYLIATSNTYQLPSAAFKDVNQVTSENYVFTGMNRRRMTAEQFADAVGKLVHPVFPDSLIKFKPDALHASFLNGDSGPRAALVVNNVFLTSLGRPNRETVTTNRDTEANLLQALELTNGDQFSKALKAGAERWRQQHGRAEDLVTNLFREALARDPSKQEIQAALNRLGSDIKREDVEDLLWSILLLPEFQIIY